jgi:zinc protease
MKRVLLALAIGAPLMAQVKLPPYTREALPNGAAVYYMRKTGLPLVSFRVLVKGGAESDPASLAGLSGLTAELLRRGAGRLSANQFADEVDGLGGTFNAATDDQATIITAEFLEKDFERGLALVADAVLRPTFPEEEVRKALARRGDQLRAAKDNPGMAIPSYYRSFFFGAAHPYGRVPDEASFGRMRRQDIVDYHHRMYAGRNLIVVVAGAFDPAQARSVVASAFGAAPAGTAYQWAEDRPAAPAASARVLLVDKPDATQTYFVIAQPGVRRTSPDRVALNLVNTLVGGRFTSMLNQELRVSSGLTYGASSRVDWNRLTGAIAVNTYTRTDSTGRAIDLALAVLKRVQESGITAEQLASAKAYVKGTFAPTRVQTADQIATVLGEMELFGLGRGEVDDFFAKVDAVTLDEANAVARRYYKPSNLTFVLLGSAAKIREAAAKYGPKVVERPVTAPGWAGQ